MHRVLLVVEGQTERGFIEQVVAPYLGTRGLDVRGMVLGKPGNKGGNVTFSRVQSDVVKLLRQESQCSVGTFVDLYQMEADWPGVPKGHGKRPLRPIPYNIVENIEKNVYDAINASFGGKLVARRFIPYIQVHEVEALLFADPTQLATTFGDPSKIPEIETMVKACGGCELINHGEDTHPAKRLESLFGRYRKGDGQRSDAIPAAKAVNVDSMRRACPRFNKWLSSLESLA